MAVFLGFCLIFLGFSGSSGAEGEKGVFGGPDGTEPVKASFATPSFTDSSGALTSFPTVDNLGAPAEEGPSDGSDILVATLKDAGTPSASLGETGPYLLYKIKKGDTIAKIALDFGISADTIINANPNMKGKRLIAGQELVILPVSGILYKMKEGETADSLAASYGVSLAQIREFNRSVNFNQLAAGTLIVLPGVTSVAQKDTKTSSNGLRNLIGYFKRPAEGFNWGRLHDRNAVDIANACGTSVIAAAEGLVVPDAFCVPTEGWNGGYGKCVSLEHPNGTKTHYAHLRTATVSLGDYMEQGDVLGTMGDSGEATGCHLHFEVEGARNPFAK